MQIADKALALEKLEAFKELLDRDGKGENVHTKIVESYGEIEEIIMELDPIAIVKVPIHFGVFQDCKTYVEAGYLSGRTIHTGQGYNQVIKVIGKLKNQISLVPETSKTDSVTTIIKTIERFRPCCEYLENPPKNEKDVQDVLWIMLRSAFDLVIREETLPQFGAKSYKPDFGIRVARTLIEAKFIGAKTSVKDIQEEILADAAPYLKNTTDYDSILVFIYDFANKIKDAHKIVSALESVDGIKKVIIIPGIAS